MALYGNADHHILCMIDDGIALITPDMGAWPAGDPISTQASMGVVSVGSPVGTANDPTGQPSSEAKMVGRANDEVASIVVAVPGAGNVTASVENGHYALFIPNTLINTANNGQWDATVTMTDGTVKHLHIAGLMMGAATAGEGITTP